MGLERSSQVHSLKLVARAEPVIAAVPAVPRSTARQWLVTAVREPLMHFVLLGLVIWAASAYWSAHRSRYLIHIGAADRERIATNYYRQFGQLPTTDQLRQFVDRYVREEIYLREGQALHLDADDEIVRRRIVQKYEFLEADLAVSDIPTDIQLQQWAKRSLSRYLTPERVAFSHVYFSVDVDGERAAKARAASTLARLRAMHVSRAADQGDPFPGPSEVSSLAPDEASRLFGKSELTSALFALPVNQWSGPYRSGYGWHLVYVTEKMASTLPGFGEIRDRVLADYQNERRREMNARAFERLRAKYTIRDDGGDSGMILPPSDARREPPSE
jgi:peptidyl-prolyl cis-trans isomerase C